LDQEAKPLKEFDDIGVIQKHSKSMRRDLIQEVDASSSKPGSTVLVDPDGNNILIDQHV